MRRRKYSLPKRMIAFALSLVLVLSMVPVTGVLAAQTVTEGVVKAETDPYTLNAWTSAFDPVNLTTEHAGGIWTDKSVLLPEDIATALPGISGLDVAENNFLVALSALGANSVVTGRGTTPTDTVFVLDISGSMSASALSAMVSAANDAIHTLLRANSGNRIGVVLYATQAYELLELGRYTPVTEGADTEDTTDDTVEYIELTNNTIRTARIETSEWVSNGGNSGPGGGGFGGGPGGGGFWQTTVTDILKVEGTTTEVDTAVSLRGGTYIQGGLWKAWEEFNSATVTDTRTPVLVLMSDGAPTYLTNDYNAVPDTYESGNGNSSGDGDAFLTQLTAAYVKEKMAGKYGTTAYMYTLGLGVSSSNQGTTVAEAVLDTSKTREDLEKYWDDFLALAAAETKTMSVDLAGENQDVTVTYDSTVTAASRKFVDKYFSASDASQLSAAFQGIVNEISLKGGYYVTRLDSAGTHASGYVTFFDEIGTGMEVKSIKGILIGDHLFTGVRLAQALMNGEFGTSDESTALGDNMVWALKQRLGVTETSVVHDLIRQAYNAGQIAYDAETGEFQNYICWFSDADGNYLGFWDYEDPYYPIPEGAAYANISYGMLGTTTDSQTAHASDMMYVAVMISKQVTEVNGEPALEAKTPEVVTFRVPAALLPTVTYQIDVEADSDEQITADTAATITYVPAEPIRLLYEVGVHSELTPENIHEFVREGYQAKDEDGNYYLYTNAWYWEPSDGSEADFSVPPTKDNDVGKDVLYNPSRNHLTYAHFEPGEQNEHYYYTEDTVLYVKDGENYVPVTGTLDTTGNTQYYYPHRTFVSQQAASATNTAVTAAVEYHYEQIDSKVLSDADNYAQNGDGQWYIKEGTMRYSIHSHDQNKTENTTGSYFARMHNLINIGLDGEEAYHSELVYLGNNGRITYSPAQGFTLVKAMAEGAEATGSFTFEITVTGDTDGKVKLDGAEQALTGGKLTVTLEAGEEVTVTGIDVGAAYTVTEQERDGYKLGGIVSESTSASYDLANAAVSDTVVENAIPTITYTNDLQYYGSLLVSKDVTYNKGSQPETDDTAFQITVTLTGMAGKTVYVNGAAATVSPEGKLTLPLKDGQQALITGIPEGTAYTVEEQNALPEGYAIAEGSFSGTIVKNETAVAAVRNEYTPDDIVLTGTEPQVSIDITKNYYLYNGHNGLLNQNRTFEFELLKYDVASSKWVPVTVNGAAVKTSTTFESPNTNEDPALGTTTNSGIILDMAGVMLDSAGSHYFRVAEVIPEAAEQQVGMTYDRTFHDFVIVVTDADLDGKLEISDVRSLQNAVVPDPTDEDNDGIAEHWNVSTEFYNSEITHSTKLTIEATKTLTGAALQDGQFEFALYETGESFDITNVEPKLAKNGAKGEIIFSTITYPYVEGTQYHYYVLKEISTSGNGITADTSVYQIRVKVTGDVSGEAVVETVEWRKQGSTDYTSANTLTDNVFSEITFNNTYKAEPVKQAISAQKTLTNITPGANNAAMTVPADKYSFTLSAVTAGAPMPANATVFAAQGGAVSFGDIEFTKAGTYVYKLVENNTNIPGVTYDTSEYTVTVVVTDNGTGNLAVSPVTYTKGGTGGTSATFVNTYLAKPATGIVLQGKKVLDVDTDKYTRTLKAGEFHFTLSGNGIAPETKSNKADGTFAFSALSFDREGTYEYSIVETGAGQSRNGVTYDAATKVVTVVVEDNGAGQLVAKVDGDPITTYDLGNFTNTYTATSAKVRIEGYKELIGRDLGENEFSFTLSGNGMAPETVKNDADGTITFSELVFDAVGTYEYTVVEEKLDENGDPIQPDADGNYIYNGVTYTEMTYTVTVTVTDNGLGTLVATVKTVDSNGEEDPVDFVNTYSAAPVDAEITATKELYDLTGGANDQLTVPANTYKFKLEALEGAPMPAEAEIFAAAGGAIRFGEIEFTKVGTYSYRLTEIDLGLGGVTSDPSVYTVEVKIRDDLKGSLAVESIRYIKESTAYNSAVFTNKYAADSVGAQITATKILTNTTPGVTNTAMTVPANTYKFKLEQITANAPMPAEAEVFAAAGGAVSFGQITYIKAGVYEYKLTEVDMGVDGVTTDITVYTVKVTIEDDGDGELFVKSIEYIGGQSGAAVFTNTYKAGSVKIHVEGDSAATDGKTFNDESSLPENGKDLDDYEFQFVLAKLDGTVIETVSDNGAGFSFEKLEFAAVGEYQYLIYEVTGDETGVTYDSAKYRVTVTVTDADLDGQLEASVKYEKASSAESNDYDTVTGVVFENTYKAKKTSVSFAGLKTLEGGRKLKGEDFSFILSDASGVIETVKNDEEGKFAFEAIEYTAEGTWVYTLKEKNDGVENIEYDGTEYIITVTVTDVNGELKAAVKIEKGEAEVDSYGFTNIYMPKDAETSIAVQKVLENKSDKTMGLDGFTFQLEVDGEKTTLTTGADGKVKFDLTFTAKDIGKTYTYKLTEVKGNVNGMTYDETVYEIQIAVTQNDDGELVLTTTRKGTGDFTFTNTYAPEPDEIPKTGVTISSGWTLMMAVSAICGLAVLVLGKKKLLAE